MLSSVHFPAVACMVLCLSGVLGHQRVKRSLTTICVEIKPSAPQEEPYYMCKGADFAPFRKGQQQLEAEQGQQQFPGPYAGSSFQSATKSKAGFPTEFQQKQPQPNFPAADFSQPQQQQPQQFFPSFPQEPLHGYDSVYNEEKPPAPSYAGPTLGSAPQQHTRSYETQPTHYRNPPTGGGQPSDARNQQQYERSYVGQPFVGATAGAGYAQPAAVPAVPAAPPTAPPTAAPQSAARYAKPAQAAAFAPPTTQTAAGTRNLNGRRLPAESELPAGRAAPERYRAMIDEDVLRVPNWGFSPEEFKLVPSLPVREATQPVFSMPRGMPAEYMDDPVMRQFYASLHEPFLGSAQPEMHTPRKPEGRVATSYDYTAPAAAPYNEAYNGASNVPSNLPYNLPAAYQPSPQYPILDTNAPQLTPAPPQYPMRGPYAPSTPSAPPQQQQQPIGEPCLLPTAAPWSSCNSCGYTSYAPPPPQPVVIAMPCMGGQPNYAPQSTPAQYTQANYNQPTNVPTVPVPTQVDYDNLAMANPMLAMANFGLFNPFYNPFSNPFMLPRGPFGGFGLLGAPANAAQLPMPPQASSQPYAPTELTAAAKSNEARMLETVSATERPSSTQTASNESGDSSEEQTEKFTSMPKLPKNKTELQLRNETTAAPTLASTGTTGPTGPTGTTGPTVATQPQPISVKSTQAADLTTERIEVPPNLGEESKKTFVTMLNAAKTLSRMSDDDADFAEDSPKSAFAKRQHQKAASQPVKRQYLHKL